MATYYVDPDDGSDSYTGLAAAFTTGTTGPWATIGKALGAAGISSGDVVYLKRAAYREQVTVAMTSPVAETKVIGDIHDEQGWASAASWPVVLWTSFTTDDSSASGTGNTLALAQRDYLTFQNIRFYAPEEGKGDNVVAAASGADYSTNITFSKCEFVHASIDTTGGGGAISLTVANGSSGGAFTWLVEDCVFWGDQQIEITANPDGATGYDVDFIIRRCIFLDGAGDSVQWRGVAGAGAPQGGEIYECGVYGSPQNAAFGINSTDTNWSTSAGVAVENCVIWMYGGSNAALEAQSSGQMTSDYNIILSAAPYLNVTKGTNDISATGTPGYRALGAMALAAPFLYNFPVKRFPWEAMTDDLSIIGDGASGNFSTAGDLFGRPRPGSGNATSTPGPLEACNIGTQETSTTHSGSAALKLTGPQVHEFDVPVDDVATTFTIYCRRQTSTYTLGTRPRMTVLANPEIGVTAGSDTGTVTLCDDAWEQLSVSKTPTAKGIVTIRLENLSTATAGVCWFDSWEVT